MASASCSTFERSFTIPRGMNDALESMFTSMQLNLDKLQIKYDLTRIRNKYDVNLIDVILSISTRLDSNFNFLGSITKDDTVSYQIFDHSNVDLLLDNENNDKCDYCFVSKKRKETLFFINGSTVISFGTDCFKKHFPKHWKQVDYINNQLFDEISKIKILSEKLINRMSVEMSKTVLTIDKQIEKFVTEKPKQYSQGMKIGSKRSERTKIIIESVTNDFFYDKLNSIRIKGVLNDGTKVVFYTKNKILLSKFKSIEAGMIIKCSSLLLVFHELTYDGLVDFWSVKINFPATENFNDLIEKL